MARKSGKIYVDIKSSRMHGERKMKKEEGTMREGLIESKTGTVIYISKGICKLVTICLGFGSWNKIVLTILNKMEYDRIPSRLTPHSHEFITNS